MFWACCSWCILKYSTTKFIFHFYSMLSSPQVTLTRWTEQNRTEHAVHKNIHFACKNTNGNIHERVVQGLYEDNLSSQHNLDLSPIQMNLWNGTSTHDGEQLCKIILKSIHSCRSYGPDNLGWTDIHTHWSTDALTHTLTSNCHCHCDNYVSLTASRLDNKSYQT